MPVWAGGGAVGARHRRRVWSGGLRPGRQPRIPGSHGGRHRPSGRGVPPPAPGLLAARTIVGVGFDRDRLLRSRHRAGRRPGRGHQRRQLQHRGGPGRPRGLLRSSGSWPASTTSAVPPSTSASASPPWPPCSGPSTGCCAASCPTPSGVEWIDPSAQVCLVERVIPDAWAGHPLAELEIPGRGPGSPACPGWARARIPAAGAAGPGGRPRLDRRSAATPSTSSTATWPPARSREATDARRPGRWRQRRHLHRP